VKILISHGSGGIGSAETFARDFFKSKGYEVHLIDYFTSHGIKNLWWSDGDNQDDHEVTFEQMFNVDFPEGDIVHIGFSLGAFLGLIHSEKFVKNYLFYPGVLGITQHMLDKDYKNTVVILASEDNGKNKYEVFEEMCKSPPPIKYTLVGAHHAFMITDIDRSFNMVRYGNLGKIMEPQEFSQLKPNHKYLSEQYGYTTMPTILKFHNDFRWQYLNMIEEQIRETFPGISKRTNLY